MLDVKLLRTDMESVKKALAKRNKDYHLDDFTEMDKVRRELIGKTEELYLIHHMNSFLTEKTIRKTKN